MDHEEATSGCERLFFRSSSITSWTCKCYYSHGHSHRPTERQKSTSSSGLLSFPLFFCLTELRTPGPISLLSGSTWANECVLWNQHPVYSHITWMNSDWLAHIDTTASQLQYITGLALDFTAWRCRADQLQASSKHLKSRVLWVILPLEQQAKSSNIPYVDVGSAFIQADVRSILKGLTNSNSL